MLRILVGLACEDDAALAWALRRARTSHGGVEVVLPALDLVDPDSVRTRAERTLSQERHAVPAAVRPLFGTLAASIAGEAADADLVVVSARSGLRGECSRWPAELIGTARCPLVFVPRTWRPGNDELSVRVRDRDDPALDAALERASRAGRALLIAQR